MYLDIWILDPAGNVLASGRPEKYPGAAESNYANAPWFTQAQATQNGTEFAVADIAVEPALGRSVATYATAIRDGKQGSGSQLGVLAIWFDWHSQAQAVVTGVHLSEEERKCSRCLLLDSAHRVIAASDGNGVLTETLPLQANQNKLGSYVDGKGSLIGYALTPGYETYKGLGWYGVVLQQA